MNRIIEQGQFDRLLEASRAVIFKHSTRCPVSAGARRQVERFLSENPDREIHLVHVIEDRPLSNYIAEKTGVEHASPQVIILKDGSVSWHDSHFEITAENLAERV